MRARTIGSPLVAVALVIAAVAPAQAAAGPSARPMRAVVPVTADVTVTRVTVDSMGTHSRQEQQKFFRDSQGRTRTEAGSIVTISDPAAGVTTTLDTSSATFQQRTRDAKAEPRPGGTGTGTSPASPPRALGTSTISGVRVEGEAYTVTIPKIGTYPGVTKEVAVWRSADLQMAVRLTMLEPSGAKYEQTYSTIRSGIDPAAHLFAVPSGYRSGTVTTARPQTSGESTIQSHFCTFAATDVLVLNSVGPFLASGVVEAVGGVGGGSEFPPYPDFPCQIVTDWSDFEYPLSGYPATPLPTFYDAWVVEDYGGWVPYIPYVAFGYVAFTFRPLVGFPAMSNTWVSEVVLLIN